MLKQLTIQNIILVERADIRFEPGLNTLTGETGSGKSAILHGLSLIIGERAETGYIRKGCDKGVVEAIFECSAPGIVDLLEEGGIDPDPSGEIIVRREILASGKGRIFINNRAAQLSFLKKAGILLVQIVGQHAVRKLFSVDYHRDMLDLFSDLTPLSVEFRKSFAREHALKKKIADFTLREAHRLREIAVCEREAEEIDDAQIKEGEDEALFAEYTLLVNAEEVSNKVTAIMQSLSDDRRPILSALNQQKQHMDDLAAFDPHLKDTADSFKNALVELEEISYSLRHYRSKLHSNPERLRTVNERLTLLNRLKRKFGSTVEEILDYRCRTEEKLAQLQNEDTELERLQDEYRAVQEETENLAQRLTVARQEGALAFERALTSELKSLNMAGAVFKVKTEPQTRTQDGDDRVEFFLSPNIGEHQIPLKDSASGGEISRVLLALQTLLAGKEQIGTLIFDEVDGNIGGETATIVGDKLRQIGSRHQVICITHFPQVAEQAHFHLRILKEEKEGRTVTLVHELDKKSRKQELARMAGAR